MPRPLTISERKALHRAAAASTDDRWRRQLLADAEASAYEIEPPAPTWRGELAKHLACWAIAAAVVAGCLLLGAA